MQQNRMQDVLVYERGYFLKVLAEARELRVLKLKLPRWAPNGGLFEYIRLDRTLRHAHFPHLYELALSQCAAKGGWLVAFLLRHKETLRRITLFNMSLDKVRPKWRGVFTTLSCQLSDLREVNLHGEFHRQFRPSILLKHRDLTGPMIDN